MSEGAGNARLPRARSEHCWPDGFAGKPTGRVDTDMTPARHRDPSSMSIRLPGDPHESKMTPMVTRYRQGFVQESCVLIGSRPRYVEAN